MEEAHGAHRAETKGKVDEVASSELTIEQADFLQPVPPRIERRRPSKNVDSRRAIEMNGKMALQAEHPGVHPDIRQRQEKLHTENQDAPNASKSPKSTSRSSTFRQALKGVLVPSSKARSPERSFLFLLVRPGALKGVLCPVPTLLDVRFGISSFEGSLQRRCPEVFAQRDNGLRL